MALDTSTIDNLMALLHAEGFPTEKSSVIEKGVTWQVLVGIGVDSDEQNEPNYILEVSYVPGIEDLNPFHYFVNLTKFLPSTYSDTARFILRVNQLLSLGHFGMVEASGDIYFRYFQPWCDRPIEPNLVVEVIWTIDYLTNRFAPLIIAVAQENVSLEKGVEILGKEILESSS
ncbi:hypothetical protein H6G36_17830 [Anabaena minutissima FACHB-250]|nr:hypothetical protein [Anabaena minutissima FACHB-250]